jgi:hypothetical protein
MKKTMNRWCVYQKRSKFARRAFSAAVNAIAIRAMSMTYPLQPGPVARLARMNPMKPRLLPAENRARLFQWEIVWTQEKNTIDHATSLWKVMFLSNGITSFKGVRRAIEIRFLHTGNRTKATSTCSTRAAERATGNVKPNCCLEPIEVSCKA